MAKDPKEIIIQQLATIAREDVPNNVDLWSGIEYMVTSKRKPKRKGQPQNLPIATIVVGLVIVIALAILGIFGIGSSQMMLLPNFGFNEANAFPIAVQHEVNITATDESGVALTVDWAYADAHRIAISYQVEYPANIPFSLSSNAIVVTTADGQILTQTSGGGGGGGGSSETITHAGILNYDGAAITGQPDMLDLILEMTTGTEPDMTMPQGGGGGGAGGGEAPSAEPVRVNFSIPFTVPFYAATQAQPVPQTAEYEGVAIELRRVSVTRTSVEFDLCYPAIADGVLPSAAVSNGVVDAPARINLPGQGAANACTEMIALISQTSDARRYTIVVDALVSAQQPTPERAAEWEAHYAELGYAVEIVVSGMGYGTRIIQPQPGTEGYEEARAYVERTLFNESQAGTWQFIVTVPE